MQATFARRLNRMHLTIEGAMCIHLLRAGPRNLDSRISGFSVPSGHDMTHDAGAEHEQTTPS
jgi:hypothetical protein